MAQQLQAHGLRGAVLEGGYAAWKAAYPVEPKSQPWVAERTTAVTDPSGRRSATGL